MRDRPKDGQPVSSSTSSSLSVEGEGAYLTTAEFFFHEMNAKRGDYLSFQPEVVYWKTLSQEMRKASRSRYPQTELNAIYIGFIHDALPIISTELSRLKSKKSKLKDKDSVDVVKVEDLYKKVKQAYGACRPIEKSYEGKNIGDIAFYTILYKSGSGQEEVSIKATATSEDLEIILKDMAETQARQDNCTASRNFFYCRRILEELGLNPFDFALEIDERGPNTDDVFREMMP